MDQAMHLDDAQWATVFAYSEWLDAEQQLLKATESDERTHAELVNTFFASRS